MRRGADPTILQAMYGDMTEEVLQQHCEQALAAAGWLYYHTYDSRRSEAGFPDIVAVRGSRVIFREVKTQKGKLSPKQLEWCNRLVVAGADYKVWRPFDWGTSSILEEIA